MSGSSSYSRLQSNSLLAHEDLNYLNEENRNESRQVVQPIGAASPKPDYIWLGKFQIYRNEGIPSVHFGIQAHLSIYASHKVLEIVDRFPELVALEELPRLRVWPSQFIESQATEEDIELYSFAKDQFSYATYYKRLMEYLTTHDLALKGNFDGVELLIFPSNVLPEKSQRLNKLLFIWGVFRRQKLENRDCKIGGALDLDVYLEGADDMVCDDEVGRFDDVHSNPSGGKILYAGCYDSSRLLHRGEADSDSLVLNRDPSVQPNSVILKEGTRMSAARVEDRTNNNAQDNLPIMEKNDTDNVEVQGMLPMEEDNDADDVYPSSPPSPSLFAPTIFKDDEDLYAFVAAVALFFLSKRSYKS